MNSIHHVRRIFAIAMLGAATLFSGRKADAQIAVSPWFIGGGYYGGGTVEGNFLSGLAQVIRAEGDYNLQTAQGMISFEEARSKYIANLSKATQAYYQMHEAHDAYLRQKHEREKWSPEALAQAAAAEVPRMLTSEELDPVTGRIFWPEVLMDPDFAAARAELERLFQLRAWTSRAPGTAAKIHEYARLMLDILRSKIEDMPASDYLASRKFLDALDYAVVARR